MISIRPRPSPFVEHFQNMPRSDIGIDRPPSDAFEPFPHAWPRSQALDLASEEFRYGKPVLRGTPL